MSLRYRDQNGNTTIIAGLTPGGDIEAGAVATREGTITTASDIVTGTNFQPLITFDSPMPDANYDITVEAVANWPNKSGGLTIVPFHNGDKTANGFKLIIYNTTGETIPAGMVIYWKATKTYTVQHAAETAASVAALEAMVPAGAGPSNKLTTQTYVDNADNALDTRLDAVEDAIPTGTTITNQLVNKSTLDTAIANVHIDVDDEISSTSENPVQNKVIYTELGKKQNLIFKGTTAEWNALSAQEKAKYDLVSLTDDSSTGDVVDAVTDGVMKPVTSNAVADFLTTGTGSLTINETLLIPTSSSLQKCGNLCHLYIRGLAKSDITGNGDLIATLPEGYRPYSSISVMLIGSYGNYGYAGFTANINTNGEIRTSTGSSNFPQDSNLSIDTVFFVH